MKIILALLLLFSFPAFAQEAAKPPADMKERIALATQFHKLRPLNEQIDLTLSEVSKTLPQTQQVRYWADMKAAFKYDVVTQASIKDMAETFTVPELKAMVDYYSKPEGQSAALKMDDYQEKLSGEVRKELDAALTKIKFPVQKSQ